ncbi:MAG TPA: hypothetical protein VGY54_05410 [Polyangiaceae bacterium]|jgi:hypothetical protein|nr:hypothetical protein [Polyangiaceae bacterium]
MTPLVSALMAASWLAFVSLYFWRRRMLQVAHERGLVHAPAGPWTRLTSRRVTPQS